MIKEAYCNNEVSELLKEKGFDWETEHKYWNPHKKIEVKRPTMQMAMRWLREIHNIDITITPDRKNNYSSLVFYHKELPFKDIGSSITYEDAVEAALKYVLENLI